MVSLMAIIAVLALYQHALTAGHRPPGDGSEEGAAASPTGVPDSILVQEAVCVSDHNVCVLELAREVPRFAKKAKGFQVKRDVRCNHGDEVAEVMTCCHALVDTINSRLEERDSGTSVLSALRGLKCTRLYCDDEECEYIGCRVDHPSSCTLPHEDSTTSTPSSPHTDDGEDTVEESSTTSSSSSSSSSSTQDPSAFKSEQGQSASTTVIVVSCLLTFLAGLGGAALIFWFCRRRRATKGSERTTASNVGSTANITGKGDDESLYEELPDDNSDCTKTNHKRSTVTTVSENEYTYIPEQTSAPPSYHVIAAEVTPPTYSEPGDHLLHRKLPTAPSALPANQSVVDRRSPGPTNVPQAPASSYSLAQPLRDISGGERGDKKADSSPVPPVHGYFVLEEDAAISTGGAMVTRGRQLTSQSPAQTAGNGGHYSSLESPRAAETENTLYTALDVGGDKDAAADDGCSRDYLEILPEYSLQKPTD